MYINHFTGCDSCGDGSPSKPYKTLFRAMRKERNVEHYSSSITGPTINGRIEQIEYMVQTDHLVIQENEACGSHSEYTKPSGSPSDTGRASSPTSDSNGSSSAVAADPAWKAACRVVEMLGGGWNVISPSGQYYWLSAFGEWEAYPSTPRSEREGNGAYSRPELAQRLFASCTTPPQDWKEPCSTSSSSSQPPTPSTASPSASGSSSGACSTSRLVERIESLDWARRTLAGRGYTVAPDLIQGLISELKGITK